MKRAGTVVFALGVVLGVLGCVALFIPPAYLAWNLAVGAMTLSSPVPAWPDRVMATATLLLFAAVPVLAAGWGLRRLAAQ